MHSGRARTETFRCISLHQWGRQFLGTNDLRSCFPTWSKSASLVLDIQRSLRIQNGIFWILVNPEFYFFLFCSVPNAWEQESDSSRVSSPPKKYLKSLTLACSRSIRNLQKTNKDIFYQIWEISKPYSFQTRVWSIQIWPEESMSQSFEHLQEPIIQMSVYVLCICF